MTGGLLLGPAGHDMFQFLLQNSVQPKDEIIDASEMMKRYPALTVPADYKAIATPDMGFLHIKKILAILTEECRKHGAELNYGCRLLKIQDN